MSLLTSAPPGASQRSPWPGLRVTAGLAAVAVAGQALLARLSVGVLSPVFLAILLGLGWRRLHEFSPRWRPGVRVSVGSVLKAGIILLGLQFSLVQVLETGQRSLALIIAGIGVAFVSVAVLAKMLQLPYRLAILIAVGTAICGNSAIAATAPVISAEETEITFASATITLFGLGAMLVYPLVGSLLSLDAHQIGILAGVGVHDAAQAIASGFLVSAEAGGTATIVKLTRTAFLVPVLVCLGAVIRRQSQPAGTGRTFPWFALGFVAAAGVRTIGDEVFPASGWWEPVPSLSAQAASFLIVIAMVGVGLQTDLTRLAAIGMRPFLVGIGASTAVGAVTLLLLLKTRGTVDEGATSSGHAVGRRPDVPLIDWPRH